MRKVVLKLELFDEKGKQKAMKTVSSLSGVDSISMDMKDKKLTVTGEIDPVTIVEKLRKICSTGIVSVGPAKEPEKKKEDPAKKDDKKKEGPTQIPVVYPPYYPYTYYYHHDQPYYNNYQPPPVSSAPYYAKVVQDDYPNTCVIS